MIENREWTNGIEVNAQSPAELEVSAVSMASAAAQPLTQADYVRSSQILESITDGFFAVDTEWRFTYINRRFEEIFGRPRQELIRQSLWEMFPDLKASPFYEHYHRAMVEQITVNVDAVAIAPSGLWLTARVCPSPDGLAVYLQEVTEKKQAEEALRRSEERYRSLVSISTSIVWTMSGEGKFIDPQPNWQTYTGQHWDDYKDWGWVQAVHPHDRERLKSLLCTQNRSQRTEPVNGRVWYAASHQYRYFEAVSVPLFNLDGSVREWVCTLTDVDDRRRSEEELRDHQHFVQRLADMAPGLLYLFDAVERRNVYINPRSLDLLGYSPETVLDMGADFMAQVMHPDDQAQMVTHFERLNAAPAGSFFDVEYRMRHRNGEWRWFTSRDTVFSRTATGQIHQILGTAQDITDRKQSENALRESEQHLKIALQTARLGAWQHDLITDTLTCSEQCKANFGLPADAEFSHQTLFAALHPDDRDRVQAAIHQAIETKTDYEVEERCIWPDGSLHWLTVRGRLVYDSDGVPVRMVGVTLDITERKQVEETLKAVNQQVSNILESITDAFVAFDHQWRYTYVNQEAARLLQRSPNELLGKNVWQEVFPEYVRTNATSYRELHRAVAEQVTVKFETFSQALNRWVEVSAFPSADGLAVYFRDISDRKQEERRKAAQHAVTRVLAEATTLVDAVPAILQSLCESLGWQVGVIWQVDPHASILRYVNSWQTPAANAHEFIDANQQMTFQLGVGLPGCIWVSRRAIWISELNADRNFPRAALAGGLHAAFGFPILLGDEILGVIECFSDRVQEPDQDLLNMMAAIGSQIGQFMERKRTEEALRESQELFQSFMHHSPIAAFIKNDTGHYIYANSFIEKVYQRQSSELIGKTDFELLPLEVAQHFCTNDKAVLDSNQPLEVLETIQFEDQPDRQQYYLSVKFPFQDASGRRLLAGIAIDITDRIQAEAALRRREEELQLITNAVPVLISYVDAQQRYRFNNRSYEEWFGHPASEIYGKQVRDVVGEAAYGNIRPYIEQVLSGQPVTFESQIPFRVVGRRYVEVNYIPRFNPQGQVEGFVALVNDISDRKHIEDVLRTSAERLSLALTASNMGDWSWDAATDIVTFSERSAEIFGIPPGPYMTWTQMRDRLHEGDREHAHLAVVQAIQQHTDYDVEYRIIRSDNRSDHEIRWVAAKGRAQYDASGQVLGMLGVVQDVTDRKRTEAEIAALNRDLQNRVNELQTLFEVIPIGILITSDLEFKHVRANPAFAHILGISNDGNASATPPNSNHNPSYKIFHNGRELAPNETPLRYAAIHGVAVERAEVDILRHDGTLFNLFGYAAPLLDEQGKVRGSVGAFLDITNRKQVEAEREQLLERERVAREAAVREAARSAAANRVKDEFLAVLSHELRTPLNPILGWAKLLRTRKFDEQATDRALETIERNARLQTQLIEDLLDISRILRGKMSLTVGPVNLAIVIGEALDTVRLAAEAKAIEIQTVLAANVGPISGDPGRLQQVVWNLLSNAIKFTPNGGRVEVRLERVDGGVEGAGGDEGDISSPPSSPSYAQITVSDTGKGISPEFLPHVFDYFRQEDGKTTRQFGGLGLGLAIVRHLTELHGGTIQAESLGEGLGSTFIVRFPLMSTALQATHGDRLRDTPSDLSQLRILVVDDEADMRELVLTILNQFGADVRSVASATEALAILESFSPDVLISDIGMPDMDGYMLIHQVRKRPPERGGTIPAIALTAYAGEVNQKQALTAGFQLHIAKPVEPEMLIQAIASLVSGN